jgi:sec-independent protein translocase protein TatA
MFGLGVPELMVILVIALVIFGPSKLPQIGSGLGKAIRDFKKGVTGGEDEETSEQTSKDTKKDNPKDLPRS